MQRLPDPGNKSYQIYILIDPRDNTVRYVGMSVNAQFRYYQHLYTGTSQRMKRWISELQLLDMAPLLQIVETINRTEEIPHEDLIAIVREREAYWMHKYLYSGAPLLNTMGIPTQYLELIRKPMLQ